MGVYKLSTQCDYDIISIYEYGIEDFGLRQSQKYLIGMHESFQILANSNFIGSDASELMPELRRFTYHSHMIFYFSTEYGVLILRVLHQSMDYRWQFLKE